LPCLNSGGALWSLIRPRWISLVAVQCVLLWWIPKTGIDLPQSRLAVVTLSASNQSGAQEERDQHSIQEKSHGSN
jgi:hypothetical protein